MRLRLTQTYTKRIMTTIWSKIKMQLGFGKIERINIVRLLGNLERYSRRACHTRRAIQRRMSIEGSSGRHYSLTDYHYTHPI